MGDPWVAEGEAWVPWELRVALLLAAVGDLWMPAEEDAGAPSAAEGKTGDSCAEDGKEGGP